MSREIVWYCAKCATSKRAEWDTGPAPTGHPLGWRNVHLHISPVNPEGRKEVGYVRPVMSHKLSLNFCPECWQDSDLVGQAMERAYAKALAEEGMVK